VNATSLPGCATAWQDRDFEGARAWLAANELEASARLFRRAGDYVDKIMRGSKPGDLPSRAADQFDLVINLITAEALGIEISPSLLARAD
jgi:ABC-type uncharacterized transport system substrate-binding protein